MQFQRIDAITIRRHYNLTSSDVCLYLGDCPIPLDFRASPISNLIANFKKQPSKKDTPAWRYKEQAIETIATHLANDLGADLVKSLTWVPVPPSKTKNHPEYDDRLMAVLEALSKMVGGLDIREMVSQIKDMEAVHVSGALRKPKALYDVYTLDKSLVEPRPEAIAIFDDLLTSGCHFKAMEMKIKDHFPDATCIGIFVGRSTR